MTQLEPKFQVGDFVLTSACIRLKLIAVISATESTVRYLLSDNAVYEESNLRAAN